MSHNRNPSNFSSISNSLLSRTINCTDPHQTTQSLQLELLRQKYRNEYKVYRQEKREKIQERFLILDNVIRSAREINEIFEGKQ